MSGVSRKRTSGASSKKASARQNATNNNNKGTLLQYFSRIPKTNNKTATQTNQPSSNKRSKTSITEGTASTVQKLSIGKENDADDTSSQIATTTPNIARNDMTSNDTNPNIARNDMSPNTTGTGSTVQNNDADTSSQISTADVDVDTTPNIARNDDDSKEAASETTTTHTNDSKEAASETTTTHTNDANATNATEATGANITNATSVTNVTNATKATNATNATKAYDSNKNNKAGNGTNASSVTNATAQGLTKAYDSNKNNKAGNGTADATKDLAAKDSIAKENGSSKSMNGATKDLAAKDGIAKAKENDSTANGATEKAAPKDGIAKENDSTTNSATKKAAPKNSTTTAIRVPLRDPKSKDKCTIPPPIIVSSADCQSALTSKSKISRALSNADDATAVKFKAVMSRVEPFLEAEQKRMVSGEAWHWPGKAEIKYGQIGIYSLARDALGKTLKHGMSFDCGSRVARQKKQYPYTGISLMDIDMLRASVASSSDPEIVSWILDLCLPALVWNPQHREKVENLIYMQLGEMIYACATKCITNNVLEKILQLPNATARHALRMHNFPDDVLAHFRQLPEGSVASITTWPTMGSALEALAAIAGPDSFLSQQLQDTKEGECVTFLMQRELYGSMLHSIQDAIRVCPRIKQLNQVLAILRPLLQALRDLDEQAEGFLETRAELCESVKKAMGKIQKGGDLGYSSYQYPSSEELAEGARGVFEQYLANPKIKVIKMERCTFCALEQHETEWVNRTIDLRSERQLVEGNRRALAIANIHGHPDKRVLITLSSFISVAPNHKLISRIRAVEGYLAEADMLYCAGQLMEAQWRHKRQVWQSFLLELLFGGDKDEDNNQSILDEEDADFDDDQSFLDEEEDADFDNDADSKDQDKHGNYRAARLIPFPKVYFLGAPRGILSVSKRLGIMHDGALYFRHDLQDELFGVLLDVYGVQAFSPICLGVPAVPGTTYLAEECVNKEAFLRKDPNLPKMVLVGADQDGKHVFDGLFMCGDCHHKMEHRERAVLQLMDPSERSEAQTKRLGVLEQRLVDKLDRLTPEQRRANSRRAEAKKRARNEQDSKAREEHLAKKKKSSQGRVRPTKTRTNDKLLQKTVRYPLWFQQMCQDAVRKFLEEQRNSDVNWTQLLKIFKTLLVREKDAIDSDTSRSTWTVSGTKYSRIKSVEMCTDGKVKYQYYALRDAVIQELGEPKPRNTSSPERWDNPHYVEGNENKEDTLDQMIANVLAQLPSRVATATAAASGGNGSNGTGNE